MSGDPNRFTAIAKRSAALSDFEFVGKQLLQLGHNPPVTLYPGMSVKAIDLLTRTMINWAKANKIEIKLPPDWK